MITPNSFLEQLKQICPDHNNGILVAVSGGADSICLLHLLHQSGIRIEAAHVNYGLRAHDSELDMKFVIDFCQSHNIPLHTKVVAKGELEAISNNTQEAARILRYNYFHELISNLNLKYVATGHHSDDQAETVLFNITRGQFKSGLAGIPSKNEHIIRPLLAFSRQDIEAYLSNNQLEYRIDQSNYTDDYNRNEIRNTVLPLLKNINPQVSAHLNQLAAHARFANFAIDQWIEKELANFVVQHADDTLDIFPDKIHCTDEFKPHVLYHILQHYGFNFLQCISISNIANVSSGSKFESSSYVLFKHDRFYHLQPQVVATNTSKIRIQSFPAQFNCGQTSYSIDMLEWKNQFDVKTFDGWCININAHDEVVITNIEPGDRMMPLGMKGFKKISDILIDKKTPLYQKPFVRKILVNNLIAALIPIGVDERFKVNGESKTILCIRQTHKE